MLALYGGLEGPLVGIGGPGGQQGKQQEKK
jgi:hypothetical protein